MMNAQTQKNLKEIEKRTRIWLDDEMDNWTDDSRARWIISKVPEVLQLVRGQEKQNKLYQKLYEALHDRNVCVAKFDEYGENDDAEGQAAILPYINHYDDEINKALADLEAHA